MKKLLLIEVILILSASILFAGGAQEGADTDDEVVTLQYWMWDPNFEEEERAFLDEFEAQNPGIKVEMTALPTGEYWTRMTSMAAAGEMPDLMANHPTNNADLAEQGVLMDLGPFMEDMDEDDYFWEILETSFEVDNTIYGVPFAWVGSVIYYNKDMFREQGVAMPTPDWTYDDFREAATQLTLDTDGDGTTDVYGYSGFSRYAVTDGWVANNDGDYLDRSTMTWSPNDGAREAIEFLNDLIHVHEVAPRPIDRDLSTNKNRVDFAQGRSAMIGAGTWAIFNFLELSPAEFDWDIAYVPRGPQARNMPHRMHAWADGLSIPASSDHPEEAWKLLRFLVEDRPVEDYYPGKVPFIRSEATAPEFDTYATSQVPPESKPLILNYGENAIHYYTKQYSVWRGYGLGQEQRGFGDLLDRAFNGEITTDELWTLADREVGRVLDQAYR